MTNRKIEYWVIPPKCDAESTANMQEVLETYEKPYDSNVPVDRMDEQPVQRIKEVMRRLNLNVHGNLYGVCSFVTHQNMVAG